LILYEVINVHTVLAVSGDSRFCAQLKSGALFINFFLLPLLATSHKISSLVQFFFDKKTEKWNDKKKRVKNLDKF
jgi:hypothetical protein